MCHRVLATVVALALVMAVMVKAPVLGARQAPSGAAATQTTPVVEAWKPPPPRNVPSRTPDGQPNLQGVWNWAADYTPLQRPPQFAGKAFLTEKEVDELVRKSAQSSYTEDPGVHYDFTEWGGDRWQNGVVKNRRTSLIVDPPDGRLPPLTPAGQKRPTVRSNLNPYWKGFPNYPHLDLFARCVTGYWDGGGPMIRPGNGPGVQGEVEILQTPGYVVLFTDSNNDTRIIPLDGRPRLSPNTTKWFGDSRGHWEGETLVVETTNFNDQARFPPNTASNIAIKNMRLIERFTKRDADTLVYRFTVEDPTMWTRPWTAEVLWPRLEGPMYEAACTEENYSILNVLKGEKAIEAAKKKTKRK